MEEGVAVLFLIIVAAGAVVPIVTGIRGLFIHAEAGVDFLNHTASGGFVGEAACCKAVPGKTIAVLEHGQQQVFGAHVGVAQLLGFLARLHQNLADTGGIGQGAFRAAGAGKNGLLHLEGERGDIDAGVFHHADGNALAELE